MRLYFNLKLRKHSKNILTIKNIFKFEENDGVHVICILLLSFNITKNIQVFVIIFFIKGIIRQKYYSFGKKNASFIA